MNTILISKVGGDLDGLIDKVNDDASPIEIVREDKPSAILMSKDEDEGMIETMHLLSTPANAARLAEAQADIEAGRYTTRIIPGVNDR